MIDLVTYVLKGKIVESVTAPATVKGDDTRIPLCL